MIAFLCMDDAVRRRLVLAGFVPSAAGNDGARRAWSRHGTSPLLHPSTLQPEHPLRLTG
ncbi:hypothetical protein [Methyloversatilis sp.]|uniref:hypothetical protein n=1 Tax=Methyloversatilis sp. TaxID=2569862 RepID=UPI002736639A|nr:hypothetical protein [Methyloversatilis sp.]MDP2868548.1 hypothetical protein [Methyloversatilis sp.]MDP3289480.1 hypothetical protein [Methyloversatilis sp.]MDP3454076.1 hypothetical protein [Methyloversatilis sp.]